VNSNSGIILTTEGVVLVDTGQNPTDSREVVEAIKKLTPLPVRAVINTEVHPDHTTGNFVFSPPALVINHDGAADAMRKAYDPERANTLSKQSPEMREAVRDYRLVTPHVEYHDRATLRVGERTFQLLYLKSSTTLIAITRCSSSASVQSCAGKSLDQIKQELRMPEYAEWAYQERMPSNIEAAYRAVK